LKETRPLWPPQRGVGLREPNLGKTNSRVSLHYSLAICFVPSFADSIIFLMLTRLVVVFIFVNFSFALFTPPLGDFRSPAVGWIPATVDWPLRRSKLRFLARRASPRCAQSSSRVGRGWEGFCRPVYGGRGIRRSRTRCARANTGGFGLR
jgi:hypothetical protein